MFQPAGKSIGTPLLSIADLGILPISYAEPPHWPIDGWRGDVKRVCDIVFALLGLVVLSIPMVLIALAIRLDSPGPALFRQRRIGFANVDFEMWKFRTMYRHASEPGRLTQATWNDRRVTRVGAILRRTSLDELPQLINVLRGDMSLIGPRPHAPGTCAGGKPFEMVTPHYAARHRVRPGLTGLAQVRGWRGETETEAKLLRRVESDLEYIDTGRCGWTSSSSRARSSRCSPGATHTERRTHDHGPTTAGSRTWRVEPTTGRLPHRRGTATDVAPYRRRGRPAGLRV